MGYRTCTRPTGERTETTATRWEGLNWGDAIGLVFWGSYLAIMVTLGTVCS